MNFEEKISVDISGMDWMINYVRWASRRLPSGGNNFSVIADIAEGFSCEALAEKVTSFEKLGAFLSGSIKRKLPDWRPHWYCNKNVKTGIILEFDRESAEIVIKNELSEGVSVKIIYFELQKKLLFTFSHAVFDGVGAEKFISFVLQPDSCDMDIARSIPPDIPAMKKSGRELQLLMKKFPEKKILRWPDVYKNTANEFRKISFAPEKYRMLEKEVEKKYGPFTFSLFILAVILCNLEKYVFAENTSAEYIFIPMSVDMRNAKPEEYDMFFNHWSLMPLLISRKKLAEGVPSALKHLKMLYAESLVAHVPQLFYEAAEAMKYVPRRFIDMFVKITPAKTLGTLMFSFLNSSNDGMVADIAHYPNMPYGSNLGFFVNICNENFNIVISRRPWRDDGEFEEFCRELEIQFQKEII